MPIHPIEYRYGTKEMKEIWTEENYLRKLLDVEVALSVVEAELGIIPKNAAETITAKAKTVSLDMVKNIEDEIGHDIMAVVLAISKKCGDFGEWVHFGATSNDIIDTARALQFKESIIVLEKHLKELLRVLIDLSYDNRKKVCSGRTHGQIAIPTTYGMRFGIWASEIDRHLDRMKELSKRLLVGKLSGAVGTMASLGADGIEVQKRLMDRLHLEPAEITNQVIQRDTYAEYLFWLANIATTLDKICIELRTLQRTEIGELRERFGNKQVGSSTMPHKRNPIKSEQVCGIARVVRSYVEPALLNNTLWDERDLTNSSCERIILPEASILADHIIRLTSKILSNLEFDERNIKNNLEILGGLNLSERIMIELAKRGVGRQEAHKIMRNIAMEVYSSGKEPINVIKNNETIKRYFKDEEIDRIMTQEDYIGMSVTIVENLVKRLEEKWF
ncbi:MAG: adenylosuccinate lyase [Candidatus Methanoliparum thermophilum]|uniref:Adenylosuccinate lyase n=1 Tax=Methanoliparum thermophilum TaxID=2491083 RepID=A0A520KQV0_METT2|nr:adenylosuccinate lyase [Candidatus Methanoliparum sp. LAM-1]RZN63927.1 MAG: adenylosuccinate lyase [Candidatus Methanoliparum thermophilum]BDC36343.1 adenylosuccinate lyase [Candidatus Methanoliparum sp. LAM-1]